MHKLFVIPIAAYMAFLIEYLLFNAFGIWFRPDLLLLLVVFFNLYSGIRYSLYAAFWAGLLRDSFGVTPLGMSIFIYISCAYLTTYLRFHFYQPGSRMSRLWVVLVTLILANLLRLVFGVMLWKVPAGDMLEVIVWPEFCITMMVTTYVFEKCKQAALALDL